MKTQATLALFTILAALSLVVASCSKGNSCVPGRTELCGCPGGHQGTQSCTTDGVYEPCQCGVAASASGGEDDLNAATLEAREEQSRLAKDKGEDYVLNIYRERLRKDPDNPLMLYLVGRYAPEGEARKTCAKATEIAPDYAWGWYCLAFQARNSGDGDSALEYAEKALKLVDYEEFRRLRKRLSLDSYDMTALRRWQGRKIEKQSRWNSVSFDVEKVAAGKDCIPELRRFKISSQNKFALWDRLVCVWGKGWNYSFISDGFQDFLLGHISFKDSNGRLYPTFVHDGDDASGTTKVYMIGLRDNRSISSIVVEP